MIGFAGIVIGLLVTRLGWPLWASIGAAFAVAILVGYLNGLITVKSEAPLVHRYARFALHPARALDRDHPRGDRSHADPLHPRRAAGPVDGEHLQRTRPHRPLRLDGGQHWIATRPNGSPSVEGIPMSIVWWIVVTLVAGWVLTRTRFGNWIYASGGDAVVARNVGVPVGRVKIILFIATACAATLMATIQVMEAGSADTVRGTLKEFEAIIAVVIGGVLLTGGYGDDRRGLRRADLRAGADGHLLHRHRHRLVQGLPRHRHPGRGARQQLRPRPGARREVGIVTAPAIELRNVSKRFGSVIALRDVSIAVNPGEVHCLLGDNGAGKSTLIKILSGVHRPSEGRSCGGQAGRFRSPRDAADAGVATVFQDLGLIPMMSIARNFFLGREPVTGVFPFRRFDQEHANAVARQALIDVGIQVRDPTQAVGTLSGGERQSVAIARAVHFGPRC